MYYINYFSITFVFLLLLLSCKFGSAQNFSDINPSSVLTDPLYNSEMKYMKMQKRHRDTIVEIREHDSLNRLVFWYRRTQPERITQIRNTGYLYDSLGKLCKQYFLDKDNYVLWDYRYDTLSMKTQVHRYDLSRLLSEAWQIQLRKDISDLQSGRMDYFEMIKKLEPLFDSIVLRSDSIGSYLLFEVTYDKQHREIQKLQFNSDGDTLLLMQSVYNNYGRLGNINYQIRKNTFIKHNFRYQDSGKDGGHLLRLDQWNYYNGDENQPASISSVNYTYNDSGQIIRIYEVINGSLISDEQFKFRKDGKQGSFSYYYLYDGKEYETLSKYKYNKQGLLSKCIVRDRMNKTKKKVYRYDYHY